MSLGSIAHLQYYFARTGILDGKGGQLAKEVKKTGSTPRLSLGTSPNEAAFSLSGKFEADLTSSPIDDDDLSQDWEEPMMLPPTVSTYSHRTQYIAPPPDSRTMIEDLQRALLEVAEALADARKYNSNNADRQKGKDASSEQGIVPVQDEEIFSNASSSNQGLHEIQGIHMLDVVTLAIRAAKIYYTMHEHPQRLATIKSERVVREELLSVLDILKRMASRQFAGGIKVDELQVIETWMKSVRELLAKEQAIEEQERRDRENWRWLEGSWTDGNREREWLFMNTFVQGEELPTWSRRSASQALPTPFLESLRNGLTLVCLHNTILKKTKRHYGEIKSFHTDTRKPYRAAENLRYWIKAAEIRWEIKLQVDVMGVVYGTSDAVWEGFDAAILTWCQTVREEITREWKQGSVQVPAILSSENMF